MILILVHLVNCSMRQGRHMKKPAQQSCGEWRVVRSWCWLMNVAGCDYAVLPWELECPL